MSKPSSLFHSSRSHQISKVGQIRSKSLKHLKCKCEIIVLGPHSCLGTCRSTNSHHMSWLGGGPVTESALRASSWYWSYGGIGVSGVHMGCWCRALHQAVQVPSSTLQLTCCIARPMSRWRFLPPSIRCTRCEVKWSPDAGHPDIELVVVKDGMHKALWKDRFNTCIREPQIHHCVRQ